MVSVIPGPVTLGNCFPNKGSVAAATEEDGHPEQEQLSRAEGTCVRKQ